MLYRFQWIVSHGSLALVSIQIPHLSHDNTSIFLSFILSSVFKFRSPDPFSWFIFQTNLQNQTENNEVFRLIPVIILNKQNRTSLAFTI